MNHITGHSLNAEQRAQVLAIVDDKPRSRLQDLEECVLHDVAGVLAAAQLRARFNLRTPDALHLACAQANGCEALWTNDDRLVSASHGLAINVLTAPV